MNLRVSAWTALTVILLALTVPLSVLTQERPANVAITGHVVKPERLAPTAADLQQLRVPQGFSVTVFAENIGKPRMLSVSNDGRIYVTRREPGDVLVVRDTNRDGRADDIRAAVRRPMLHGIALDGRRVYLVTVKDVLAADIAEDGTFSNVSPLVDDLPDSGQHPNRTLALGPDGHLYVSVGSTCNACTESSPESATLLRLSTDGTSRQIYASGLRNTIGFGWHPQSGDLFGMDHGIDWLGDDDQPEELNRIERGKQYGWPYVYAAGKINPQDEPPGDVTSDEWARLSVNPVLTYTAHAAPMQMVFYQGAQFPAAYRGDAFVAMHGSWNRKTPSGYEVVRIRFADGEPTKFEPFLTGFLTQRGGRPAMIGRPVGLAITQDGALLVADDLNGRIYRVVHQGEGAEARPTAAKTAAKSSTPPADSPNGGGNTALAMAREETKASGTLTVSSSAFSADGAIPRPYTEYGEGFSPAISWGGAPAGVKSFAILMEDPDAKTPKPFVHWVIFNIPSGTTSLPEGIPTPLRLKDPKGTQQGQNSRGQTGYFGPRPPAGDPPHHYHFQVFALDTILAVPPGADRDAVLKAMRGHVLARGEYVGTYQQRR